MVSPVSSCVTPSSSTTTTTCSLTNSSTKPPSSTRSPETHVCPYPTCAKSFSKKYNLKAHLRLHTGEQPFECDRPDCNKKFKWRSSLSSHTVWHSRKDKSNSATTCSSSSSSSATTNILNNNNNNNNKSTNNSDNKAPSSSNLTACSSAPSANAASTTASSPASNRKRPRAASRTMPTSTSSVDLTKLSNGTNSRRTSSSSSKPPAKKHKKSCKPSAPVQPASHAHVVQLGTSADSVLPAPCSPLTDAASFFDYSSATDSGVESQPMLQLDDFSEHVLSLDVRHADAPCLQMQIGLEDVASIMDDADECGGLFSHYANGSCANLSPLDTRFGPFDLDNLQAFSVNTTVEGL